MKKLILSIILTSLILTTPKVLAEETTVEVASNKIPVTLIKCESANESWVKKGNETLRIKLLAYTSDNTPLTNEIDSYACNILNNAQNIEIEYDESSEKTDKYNRELVYVYVDGSLLQDKLISLGYGQVNKVSSNLKELNNLCAKEAQSVSSSLGIWTYQDTEEQFCDSGRILKDQEEILKEEIETTKKINIKTLKFMVLINSAMVLFLIIYFLNRKKEKYGKR